MENKGNTEETIESLRAENRAYKERVSELEKQVDLLREAIRLARQKQFGPSSERSSGEEMEQLSLLFNETEVYVDQEKKVEEKESSVAVAAHERRKKREYTLDNLPENVPVEVIEHEPGEEELECPVCGETMREIGVDTRRRLKIIPAQVVVIEDRYHVYACRNCDKNGTETPIAKCGREPNFMPGSFAIPETVAHIATQKFVMGSPLYRQAQELARHGIPLSRQTMSNWLIWVSENILEPVYRMLHTQLFCLVSSVCRYSAAMEEHLHYLVGSADMDCFSNQG